MAERATGGYGCHAWMLDGKLFYVEPAYQSAEMPVVAQWFTKERQLKIKKHSWEEFHRVYLAAQTASRTR